MYCHNLCQQLKVGWKKNGNMDQKYINGLKYCSICRTWFKGYMRCPCCKNKLRTRPRSHICKVKFRESLLEVKNDHKK